jgi:hypothetical protein
LTTDESIVAALDRAGSALDSGGSLRGTGFWRAVDAVRRDPALAERYGDHIAAIDRRAFERGVRLRVPLWVGVPQLTVLTLMGAAAITTARVTADACVAGDPLYDLCWWGGRRFVPIAFLLGLVWLILGTHSLAHWIVGRVLGIRFTHVFLGGPKPARPGVKTDYASYLRATPRRRAAMHASGAVVTKLLPFALMPVAAGLYADWPWLMWILTVIGVAQIVTDVFLSTKVSDWKKVLRELRAAR